MAIFSPTSATRLSIELTEWDQVGPGRDIRLKGLSLGDSRQAHLLAESLHGRVNVREGLDGLEICTTSFVGYVDVGPLRIAIKPKLPTMPLSQLLSYAYGLRDITTIYRSRSPTTRDGLHDILIELLAEEVEELLHRGLWRRYVPSSDRLESPRGQILIDEIIYRGGVREARLPCRYFDLRKNWHLNQLLRSGLLLAAQLTEDRELHRRVQQLSSMFGEVQTLAHLNKDDIDRAEHDLTRQTDAAKPALTLIRLLRDSQGIDFATAGPSAQIPGFLFDMNAFFQRLLSRFLRDNVTTLRIEDEVPIRGLFAYPGDANPKHRRAPAPRPDFALYSATGLVGFLDAKYRDIWDCGFPPEWLYQLSIYALASPSAVSILLYASMSEDACDERVEIRQPISWGSKTPASVIMRAVSLTRLAALLVRNRGPIFVAGRRELATELVARCSKPRTQMWSPCTASSTTLPASSSVRVISEATALQS